MGSKSKKPTQESIDLDQFLTELTEVELETESKTIFTLCESLREMALYKAEGAVMDSFLQWARNENGKHQERITGMDNGTAAVKIDPIQGELNPVKDQYFITIKIETDRQLMFREIPEIIKEEINNGAATILEAGTYESWKEGKGKL